MAALRVRVLGAKAVVGVADEGWGYGGSYESLAGDRVDPVGGAGTGGKIVCDGLRISGVLSHLAKERREGGPRVAEAFIDRNFLLLFTHLRTRSGQLNRSPSSPTCFQRGPPFSPPSPNNSVLVPLPPSPSQFSACPFHSPCPPPPPCHACLHPARCIMHHRPYMNTHLTHRSGHHPPLDRVGHFLFFKVGEPVSLPDAGLRNREFVAPLDAPVPHSGRCVINSAMTKPNWSLCFP